MWGRGWNPTEGGSRLSSRAPGGELSRARVSRPGPRIVPLSGKGGLLETSDWLLVVASVVLGQFALLAIEVARGQLERRQRLADRRADFRREQMIELLVPAHEVMEFIHRFYYPRAVASWEGGDWPYEPEAYSHLSEAQELEYEQISVRARTLSNLIADEPVGQAVDALLTAARRLFDAGTQQDADAAYTAANDAYLSLAKRIGEVQQKL